MNTLFTVEIFSKVGVSIKFCKNFYKFRSRILVDKNVSKISIEQALLKILSCNTKLSAVAIQIV